jgi:hypothetical protein
VGRKGVCPAGQEMAMDVLYGWIDGWMDGIEVKREGMINDDCKNIKYNKSFVKCLPSPGLVTLGPGETERECLLGPDRMDGWWYRQHPDRGR